MKSYICPNVTICKSCADPYNCPLEDDCWGFLPPSSVFDLSRGGKKSFELFANGIHSIKDIPEDFKLSDKQGIQHECERTGKIHVNKEKIKEFLDTLEKPAYYLDFETFSTAVPLFDGVKPYQQIPFQFSLHINGKHFEFLADGGDPRAEFIKELQKVLGKDGSIVVYNQSFEKMILKQLAEKFPEYEEWVSSVFKRIVDLYAPFRNFYYYNPKQKGSASIKKVLPAVTGKDYSDLEIADGGTASVSYLHSVYGECKEKIKIREDLLRYCELDTEGMIWIVEDLEKLKAEKGGELV